MTSSNFFILKDPDAVLDYGFDWATAGWLPSGDIIAASAWTVPTDLTIIAQTHDDTTTTVWLSGGQVDQIYTVTNHITTNNGRQDDRSLIIRCIER